MKKIKLLSTILVFSIMLCFGVFGVYALSSFSFNLPSRNIGFTAGENVFFNAEISYLWQDNSKLSFQISNKTGEPESLDDNVVINNLGNYYELSLIEGSIPDIQFVDINSAFDTSYKISNTGDSAISFKISGIVFDNQADQRFTTKIKYTQNSNPVEIVVNNETLNSNGFEKGDSTCSISLELQPEESISVIVSYQLARMNSDISLTENIALDFSLAN